MRTNPETPGFHGLLTATPPPPLAARTLGQGGGEAGGMNIRDVMPGFIFVPEELLSGEMGSV